MTARKCLGFGLIAGLARAEALGMPPGMIVDLYIMRRDYDDALHGIERRSAGKWSDE